MGSTAPHASVHWPELLGTLDPERQMTAIGKSLSRLVRKGVVGFDDVAEPGRVRSFVEVISKLRIPLKTLIGAGIAASVAEKAFHEARDARGRDWAAEHARDLRGRIRDVRAAHEGLVDHLRRAIPTAVAAPVSPPVVATPPGVVGAFLALLGRRRRLTAEERKVVAAELSDDAARSVDDFLAAAGGRKLSEAVEAIFRKYSR